MHCKIDQNLIFVVLICIKLICWINKIKKKLAEDIKEEYRRERVLVGIPCPFFGFPFNSGSTEQCVSTSFLRVEVGVHYEF